jgi:Protein of unknown function (DUF3955)
VLRGLWRAKQKGWRCSLPWTLLLLGCCLRLPFEWIAPVVDADGTLHEAFYLQALSHLLIVIGGVALALQTVCSYLPPRSSRMRSSK